MHDTDRFTHCQIALLALLWAELEEWVIAIEAAEWATANHRECRSVSAVPAERIEAFLLELALLHDCPDSFTLRRVLRTDEAVRLRRVVGDVWRLLDVRPFESSAGQVCSAARCAQERLFEELQAVAREVGGRDDRDRSETDPPGVLLRGTGDEFVEVWLARA